MTQRARRSRLQGIVVTFAMAGAGCGASASPRPREPEPSAMRIDSVVRRTGESCTIHFLTSDCPSGAVCNPPAPREFPCPPGLADRGRIERDLDGVCTQVEPICPPPVLSTCNPPPPRVVECDTTQPVVRDAQGRCLQFPDVQCPEPYQPPCTDGERRTVACPPPAEP